jgi:hypothetical protein
MVFQEPLGMESPAATDSEALDCAANIQKKITFAFQLSQTACAAPLLYLAMVLELTSGWKLGSFRFRP